MRCVIVPVILVLGVLVGACGAEPAPVASVPGTAGGPTPTQVPTEDLGGLTPEEYAHREWLAGGPVATSTPTRTCVQHIPTEEEWAAYAAAVTDEDRIAADPNWTSCFDTTGFTTAPPPEPTCDVPSDLPADGIHTCVTVRSAPLTQRSVDDWNAFADREDSAGARLLGMTLDEYRAAFPDAQG